MEGVKPAMEVEGIPMVGRRFTWNKANGGSKSRIYRMLVPSHLIGWITGGKECNSF